MEVKPGYKQTEVGVIPNGWEVKSLGELGSVVRGGSPRPAGDSRYFNGNFIPWLTVAALTNIPDHQIHVLETTGYLTEEGSKRSRTLISGTLIIANSGATLGVAKLLGVTCCANDGVAAIISQRLGNKGFVCQYINTRTKHLRETIATGNGQPNLNTALIREILIPYPPLPEQRAIAEALGDVDALLGALDRLIAKKRDLKQAAMQQLLTGQTRLPGFEGKWEVTTLGDIGECIIGLTYKPEDVVHHGLLVLRSSNVQNGRLAYDDNVYVNLEVSEHLYTKVGDLLICVRNGSRALIGKCAVIDQSAAGLTFGAFMAVYRTKHWQFVVHAFQGDDIQRQIRDNIGATINQITNKDMKAFRLQLPPEAEQAAIADVLSDMDAELAELERRRDKTRMIKQGMMQELLTGRTRLL